jgi:Flp pilus assembly protein TadG
MTLSISAIGRFFRGLLRDQRKGSTMVIAATLVPVGLGIAGLSVDLGRAYAGKRALQSGTQAAAMAGAYALQSTSATLTTVSAAITSWNSNNPVSFVTITNTTPTLACVTSTSNLPSCSGTSPNAVTVTQTATVTATFAQVLGFSSFALSSTATAATAGGNAKSLNVMFVLDATRSMGTTVDPGCTVPGISSPTRFQCAQYSIQSILKTMPSTLDKVGLMVFPGMGTQYSPTSHPCPIQPTPIPYLSSNIKYQIGTSLDSTYNDGSGALVTSSPMIQAVGSGTTLTGCVTAIGGEGSYAAEVLTKAQAALPAVTAGTQNVIIFLSDGDYNASSSQLNGQSTKVSKQCDQAVTAAGAAATAGTVVYAVAYGAPTSGCSSGDTHNPCTTMQAIASDSSKFYSTDTSCKITGSPNVVSQLPNVFKAIGTSLTKPRLVLQ